IEKYDHDIYELIAKCKDIYVKSYAVLNPSINLQQKKEAYIKNYAETYTEKFETHYKKYKLEYYTNILNNELMNNIAVYADKIYNSDKYSFNLRIFKTNSYAI